MAKLRVDKIASVGVSTENTGSVFFDGSGDYLSVADSDDFHYGSGDFTAECWVYPTASPNQPMLVGQWSGSTGSTTLSWVMMLSNDSNRYLRGLMSSNTSAVDFDLVSSASLELNQWSHCAFVKTDSTFTLYLNGVNVASTTDSDTLSNATNALTIGATSSGAQPFQGYLSNVRVCKGHAVYTSNFTPPTRELEVHEGPDDDRTVLLACYDGENIFADKTGRHIIAAYGDRTSSPTPTATDSPIGITTNNPGLVRDVDNTFGPTFQGGAGFTSQNWLTLPKGTTTERFPDFGAVDAASARGVFAGGLVEPSPTRLNTIDYITISTLGNAQDFGDLVDLSQYPGGVAGSVRGVIAGGYNGSSFINTINYVTIASTGDAKDFGDLTLARNQLTGASNSTRGLFAGGNPETEIVDYITIQSQGNAFDFGDLLTSIQNPAGCADSTRALFGGGEDTPTSIDVIQYFNISTTSNSTDFGNLTQSRRVASAGSSKTRGLFAGGRNPGSTQYDIIDFVTIQTLGNATDFGNLSATRSEVATVTSTLRACFGGGYASPNSTNIIEYVTIPSAGNAIDFGDLTVTRRSAAGVSNGHGGLG